MRWNMDPQTPEQQQHQQVDKRHQPTCLRCNLEMHLLGRRAFHEPSMWAHSYFRELCSPEKFDVYFCNQCGSISLFIAQGQV